MRKAVTPMSTYLAALNNWQLPESGESASLDLEINQSAIDRVRNPLPPPTTCHLCGGAVELVRNSEIYNGRTYGRWPYAYLCRECGAYVGLHPHTDIPLGTLADKATREARKRCKSLFENLHRGEGAIFGSRSDAYAWLAEQMGLPVEECHWGWFDAEQCQQAADHCLEKTGAAEMMPERVYIRFADNGNIRKWQPEPFPEGNEYVRADLIPAAPEVGCD